MLKHVQSVRCNGCVWHGSALEALVEVLRMNSNLQVVNIRMNEKQWDAKRDMTLSKMLGGLAARQQQNGSTSLKFIDFGGLPTGNMNQVMQCRGDLMARVQNLCVTCTPLRGDFKEGPDTLVCSLLTSPIFLFLYILLCEMCHRIGILQGAGGAVNPAQPCTG